MQDFSFDLVEDRKIDFIEQFNEKLLVKQESTNLQVRFRVYHTSVTGGDCNCRPVLVYAAISASAVSVAVVSSQISSVVGSCSHTHV